MGLAGKEFEFARDSFRFVRVLSFLGRTGRPCEAQREDVTVGLALTVHFSFRNCKAPSWGDKAKPPISHTAALLFDP